MDDKTEYDEMESLKYGQPTKPVGLRKKAVFRQVLMSVLANMSVVSPGMALGFPAVTLKQLTDPNEPITLSESQASWYASVTSLACPIGGLLSAFLLDRIGRKWTIMVINFTSIIAWALIFFSSKTNADAMYFQIMVSRVLIGITTGLASSPVGVYSAEVCHPKLRGRLTLGTSIATATGIMFIYILGYFIRNDFRLIAIIVCGYSVITSLVMIPVPESPNWLMMKGRTHRAEQSLKFFRGFGKKENVKNIEFENELNHMTSPLTNHRNKENIFKTLRRPEVYKPLLIMIGFFGCQQFSGIFVVIVYAVQFSIEAGVSIDPILCAIFIGMTRLLTTFLVGYMLDKFGRRPPAIASGIGMATCMFILSCTIWFPSISFPFLGVICIILYIFTSTLGLMTLPFSMISEVYPRDCSGLAAGITICCGFIMSFLIVKLFPEMIHSMGKENVFAFYGAISLVAVGYIYFLLPETKNKTLKEIEESFKNNTFKEKAKKMVELQEIRTTK